MYKLISYRGIDRVEKEMNLSRILRKISYIETDGLHQNDVSSVELLLILYSSTVSTGF